MNFEVTLHRILRILSVYAALAMILLICVCAGVWSVFEISFQFINDAFQNIFQRTRNVISVESDDETSKEVKPTPLWVKVQNRRKPLNRPNVTILDSTSSAAFSDSTESGNTATEKAAGKTEASADKQTKETLSNLEGLALQMVHLEQQRISPNYPLGSSSSEFGINDPNLSVPGNRTAPKSVLKSSSETKPSSDRSTRRIRFQDPPSYDISKWSFVCSTSPKSGSSSTGATSPKSGSSSTGATSPKSGSSSTGATSPKSGSSFTGATSPKSGSSSTGATSPNSGSSSTGATSPKSGSSSTGSMSPKSGRTYTSFTSPKSGSPYAGFTSPKSSCWQGRRLRKLSPASYLKAGLNFQESPVKSSETKSCVIEQSAEEVPAENAQMINLSTEKASNEQLAKETKSLSEESNSFIPTAFSSKTADSKQITNESMASLSEESNANKSLSSRTTTNQQIADESVGSLTDELNPTLSVLSTKTEANQHVSNESMEFSPEAISTALPSETATSEEIGNEFMDPSSEELDLTTELPSKIATNQQLANESVDYLSEELNLTNPLVLPTKTATNQVSGESTCSLSQEFDSNNSILSSKTDFNQQIGNESMDSLPGKLASNVPMTYKKSEVPSEDGDQRKISEQESTLKLKAKEISLLEETSEELSTHLLQALNLCSESTSQQSTEMETANLSKSTSSGELNPTKTDELCESLDSEDTFDLESKESTVIADHKEASRKTKTLTLNKVDEKKLHDKLSVETSHCETSSEEEESLKNEE